jgi:hypothetical protein
MACSPSGNLLATVGRDRKLIVWEMTGSGIQSWRTVASESKAHARVIWGCSWLDERRLVTCSRDGMVRVWDVDTGAGLIACHGSTKLGSSVMSVSCDPNGNGASGANGTRFAAGLESGEVLILDVAGGGCEPGTYSETPGTYSLDIVAACAEEHRHAGAVRRVGWRPGEQLISSVGDDGAVKFFLLGGCCEGVRE